MPQDEVHLGREDLHKSMNQSRHMLFLQTGSSTEETVKSVNAAILLQNASSIQSMLRNTTEKGGVGQFSQSQRQASSPGFGKTSKVFPRPRGASRNFPPSLPRRRQEPRFGSGRCMPEVPRYGSASPTSGPDPQSPSTISYQEPTRSTSVEEYRTFTTTENSYSAHDLDNRRPHVHNARHQNRGQMQRVRPRSPFAYPTRLKQPGYRPSSPALSLNRSIHNSDFERADGSRTASPASMYNLNRIPTPWQQVVNRSDPMLRYYPPVQGLPSSRGSTPKPTPSVGSVASSARLSQVALHYPGAWPISPAVTPPPLFYDYSEAFEEQTRVHRISVSIVTSPVSHIDSDQSQYWERPQNTESEFLVEFPSGSLPAPLVELNVFRPDNSRPQSVNGYQNANISSNSMQQTKPPNPSASSPPNSQLMRSHSTSFMTKDKGIQKHAMTLTPVALASSANTLEKASEIAENSEVHVHSFTDHQATTSGPLTSEHDESSPVASIYSFQSSAKGETLEDGAEPTSAADTAETSPDGPPKTPINQVYFTECTHQLPKSRDSKTSKTSKTSDSVESVSVDYSEILAPTPERSIISLRNCERFSKILGLDQGLHEVDGFSTLAKPQESRSRYFVDSGLKNEESLQHRMSPSLASRHTINEEDELNDGTQLKCDLIEISEKSNANGYETSTQSSSISPRPAAHDSPGLSTVRDSPKWESPTPNNVGLSHRRIVINAGQKIEARSEAVHKSSTIAEDQVQETIDVSAPDNPQLTHIDNALPQALTPSIPIKTFAPPKSTSKSDLPFAFTPLIQPANEDGSSPDLEAMAASFIQTQEVQNERNQIAPPIAEMDSERVSTASPAASRPWNLDASYPWDDNEPPKLDVVMPLQERDSLQSREKLPKFRLRIHRASSSTASKLTKKNRSSEDTISSVIASSVDLLKSASFRRAQKPSPSIGPGDSNSSHEITRTSPMQTRFVESFEQPSLVSPVISLMPPSPALDVRSFFSDDSSQSRPKGSLRKRLSDFRTRNSRANSVENAAGYDRGLLTSAFGLSRASGRSSRQSQITTVATSYRSPTRPLRWTIFAKIRSWFSRREDEIRQWKRKRSVATQTEVLRLHAGV